ncbi:MAG: hypothetical protein JWN70_4819 [Planctomycetaceae bacterium]|nr:hypothetical protein [Planctomycetaceae bacterium]
MNSESRSRLELPGSLETQMHEFRRRVWTIKSLEAVGGAICGVVIGYLTVYLLDRVNNTPAVARLAIFLLALLCCAVVPVYLHKWIWRQRSLDQLARLLSRRYPSLGDQMLGIVELVRSDFEQHRSMALCQAAIVQVAAEAEQRDFSDAVPTPRHRQWMWAAAVPALGAIALLAVYPAAATNAWARFLSPWRNVPRYTFASIEKLPERLVVPHGEEVTIPVRLKSDSRWKPEQGKLQVGHAQAPVTSPLKDGGYQFSLPPQIAPANMKLKIGDVLEDVLLEPMLRPELATVSAAVRLPDYLERAKHLQKDARGGSLSLVKGSVATFTATANRDLKQATVDREPAEVKGRAVTSSPHWIEDSLKLVFRWQDEHGLSGQAPFTVAINARDDEAPSLSSEGLPRQQVVLNSEVLKFQVQALDDFGVKRVGIEWRAIGETGPSNKVLGERLLASGGSEQESLDLTGTFCAEQLKIEPQSLSVRLYAEDFLPGRERVYSPAYTLHVLSAEEHAIWVTEQLSKWHHQSLEVRDRELQLHHTNQQLKMLSPEELDQPDNRRQIEAQSAAERANGRRLTGLTASGEELIRQALRNPEFGVGHLEKWAEMLQILKDISANRMPNVADLLAQSARSAGKPSPNKSGPQAGQVKSTTGGPGNSKPGDPAPPKPPVPTIVDRESSQQPAPKDAPPEEDGNKSKPSSPRLTLPTTTVASPSNKKPSNPAPAAAKLDEAIKAQQELLAEFEKIADELDQLLANLEGSTLVKRLKAASRKQYTIAGKIADHVGGAFGQAAKVQADTKEVLTQVSTQESNASQDASRIMDDLEAYFERRRYQRFKVVLDEMRKEDAVGSLRELADDVVKESGLSIAQCEFWSDTFDRWADNLLDPACNGKCPGGKSKASLPPSIVLEAMHILEAEMNLREETRVVQQARKGLTKEDFSKQAGAASQTQAGLTERVNKLTGRIRELPDGEQEFGYEIDLLGKVEVVMQDATEILARPETGPPAIGAETEAIELLLKSKRINPKGGGGGGASPGGGGSGTTRDAALALFGAGVNDKEIREERDVGSATGVAGTALPEEFRAGLDKYFNRIEGGGKE